MKKVRGNIGLRWKLVLLVTVLAIVTYSTSAFFLYVISEFAKDFVSETTFAIATIVAGIFWSGVLAFFAAGVVTKPLQRLEAAVKKAADGDIGEDVILPKSKDEVRSLAVAFNQMLASLRLIVTNIEENVTQTTSKVAEMNDASKNATNQAELISQTIESISKGADQSAVAVQETAESVDHVIKLAEEVQNKANFSADRSVAMVESLKESQGAIDSLITGLTKQVDSSHVSLQAVKRLDENAQRVNDIITLVGDIAQQTNLLALNAAIEAARAGEHGKGFAVVADEVRKLADGSSQAVQDISTLIEEIQTEVSNVVVQITEQVEVGNSEAKNGEITNAAIKTMTDSVHEVANSVKQITELVDHQMDSIKQTAIQSQEVAAIAEETSAGTEEMAASTEEQVQVIEHIYTLSKEFTHQAQELKKTIEQFRL
ncbi:methyl-accepting chemotaxis protein [Bacillus sp. PS06]|nr:methyl-accepting chemotaxis protein [Bacillus sp. PS06]MBD8069515.1 methyl-accepting chemotaxis protein [Bacillus sp. PS06]